MRKTKIICTIGPASANEETLTQMVKNGMNVCRLNFSHGTLEEQQEKIDLIKSVREKMNVPLPIMLDSKGPEVRIKTFENKAIELNEGDTFTFTTDEIIGNKERVSITYKDMTKDLVIGDKILLCNGLLTFEVFEVTKTDAICKVLNGGTLSDRKSMNFPNKVLNFPYISEQDKKDFLFGIKNEVEFIACSFVSSAQNLIDVRKFLKENGGENIDLIAKIENRSGVNNIEEIVELSNGIMVARGDMGVEIPFEELPAIQKKLISCCRLNGKRSITATEMLESMINNPRPTRAEISDVANAVYDGTSAIMLSGETAMGKYPTEVVATMSKIAKETEKNIDYEKRFKNTDFKIKNSSDAISHSTVGVAIDIKAKTIVVCTKTGSTARMVSRFRPYMPILGLTTEINIWRKLALSWGVIPHLMEEVSSTDILFFQAGITAKNLGLASKKDNIVITAGAPVGVAGKTNLIKVEEIK